MASEDRPIRLPRLVLFSGPPGVGKSTLSYALSRRTGWVVIAKDGLDRTLELDTVGSLSPITAYHLMLGIADLNLRNGASLILDAVFGKQDFREQASAMAERHGVRFHAVVCRCGDDALWRHRVERRSVMVAGWTPADWDEVQRVITYYEPWTTPHLALNAVDPLAYNLKLLIDYVTTSD